MILSLPSFPSTAIHVLFLENVKNADALRNNIVSSHFASLTYSVAAIEASMVADVLHLSQAVQKALSFKKLRTKTVSAEIILNLSPSKNITSALSKFGVKSTSNNIILVFVGATDAETKTFCDQYIQADSILHDELQISSSIQKTCDISTIKNLFKVKETSTFDRRPLIDYVLSTLAVKDL